ncbi:hypothetical protein HOU26_gp69 [Escherichia phage IMM-002]|uniref:Uncharacterized protein n=1 Tax=Escherichia phage IMM-002 TaxID=2041760 RepID=A0A384WIP6_9CAUD|nr:hypothetical protein HOU26_gp69 [Escherichia phage IMM-002]ATI17028.1 hypothetical protein [Escherichia phage IMM-002]
MFPMLLLRIPRVAIVITPYRLRCLRYPPAIRLCTYRPVSGY